MDTLNIITAEASRNMDGGRLYRCKHCGYTSSSYARTYANALRCVTRKYGYVVWRIVSAIF